MSGLLSSYAEEEEEEEETGGLVAYGHDEEEEEEEENEEASLKSENSSAEAKIQSTKAEDSTQGDEQEDDQEDDAECVSNGKRKLEMDEDEDLQDERSADYIEDHSFHSLEDDGRPLIETMLPPRPARPPDAALQGKIVQFHRLRREGRAKSINEKIRHSHNFKNPYMLNWLVSHCGIDETGSNYPRELFDPAAIRHEATDVMERQRQQKLTQQNRTAIDFTKGVESGSAVAGMGMARPLVQVVEGTKRAPPPPPSSTTTSTIMSSTTTTTTTTSVTSSSASSSSTTQPPAKRSKWDQVEVATTSAQTAGASRYAEYALAKKAEIEAKMQRGGGGQ